MAKKKRWTRIETKSGPANLLDGRWKVGRFDLWWGAYDRENKIPVYEPGHGFNKRLTAGTMRELKTKLQDLVDTGVLK